jgi:hypothetical protein
MEVMLIRYQERMHVSYEDAAMKTPWSEIERAFYIWSLDSERDKLEIERQRGV